MALVTSQQLSQYYNSYMDIDVTFTKQVSRVTGMLSNQTFLRFLGDQLPCIIYSCSMKGAKVITSVGQDLFQRIREANNLVLLRFCFKDSDKQDPISFFVASRVAGFNPYSAEQKDLNFVTMTFTQRPSDDLIGILGLLLEANINSKKRKEERIEINPETMRKLGLPSKDALVYIDKEPRKCLLRDLSFSGAKVLMTGVAAPDTEVKLVIPTDVGRPADEIIGKVVRYDEFPDKPGIGAVGIQFDEQQVSMEYKVRLNEYLTTLRKP